MAVAIVHYHLRRGGVTRVIEAQSQGLRSKNIDHVIISGTPYCGQADLPVVVVPGLDYDERFQQSAAESTHQTLLAEAEAALGVPPRLWHFHNPTLGKNAHYPFLIHALAEKGERMVLHFHDFAEDGRPGNYTHLVDWEELYPLAPQIRYAFINSRDRALLIAAGVPEDQTVLLPNAVIPPALPATASPLASPLVLYPVRGIRRKNLGEVCLLSALAPPGVRFAVTLAPGNPKWKPIHRQWVQFARDHDLPVQFGVVGTTPPAPGLPPDYENWLAQATHLLTTSIAEGFGLAFLEPLALRKPLFGRDLPDITTDFKHNGLQLGTLYDHLLVPAGWIDRDRLLSRLVEAMGRSYESYGMALEARLVRRASDALLLGESLDFGNLPEDLQRETFSRALQEPDLVQVDLAGAPQPAAPWLAATLARTSPAPDASALQRYSVANYAGLLDRLYRDLQDASPAAPGWLDKSRVLRQFLKPERFHFLRT